MSVRFGIIVISTKRKEGDNMSANVYNVQTLLVGKEYRSNTLTGKIVSAEPHPHAVWYEGCESYLVEIQPDNRILTTYRTVAVKVGE
jgi:adenylate cyclase